MRAETRRRGEEGLGASRRAWADAGIFASPRLRAQQTSLRLVRRSARKKSTSYKQLFSNVTFLTPTTTRQRRASALAMVNHRRRGDLARDSQRPARRAASCG